MESLEKILRHYDYQFPPELIAQKPATPRDSAKLLIYNRKAGKTSFDTFRNITKYLPKGAVLVFNQTKVVPARLELKKETGGKVRILYLQHDQRQIKVMADRKLAIGSRLFLTPKPRRNPDTSILRGEIYFKVVSQKEQFFFLAPSFPISKIFSILNQYGHTPIPPYIKHSPLSEKELRRQYQTVFAHEQGSVAAPTASLHFTKSLNHKIKKSGFEIHFVTLHVNLGTFAPLTEEQLKTGRLHHEHFEISAEVARALARAKHDGRPIIAVGTTVVRTLESNHSYFLKKVRMIEDEKKRKIVTGETNLFIREGYRFKVVDGLITNFHVPRSSLMMLVAALVGREKLLELYRLAIRRRYRLFSFGDGMLIL